MATYRDHLGNEVYTPDNKPPTYGTQVVSYLGGQRTEGTWLSNVFVPNKPNS